MSLRELLEANPDELAELINAEKAKRSLGEFVKQYWPIIEPGTSFVPNWHIDAICDHLTAITRGDIRNLLINMPPRHMKSLLVSVFWPVWEWLQMPWQQWLFTSYGQHLSIRDSVKRRDIITSPKFQRAFGHLFQLRDDQATKVKLANDRMGHFIATSVGGVGTGEGGNRIVCDDPHKVDEAESQLIRESTIEWWNQTMSTRLNDPKRGAKIVVMQRVHDKDLAGTLLESGDYTHLCLPAEYEGNSAPTQLGWSDPRTQAGQPLWPERFGKDELESLKRQLGSLGSAGQLQQRPVPAEGGLVKLAWFEDTRYDPATFDFSEITTIILVWDTGFKTKSTSDFSVCAVWGMDGDGNYYLLDLWRRRVEYPDLKKKAREMADEWPHRLFLIEDAASGQSLIQELRRDTGIPLKAWRPDRDKTARLNSITPLMEGGRVWLPTEAPWLAIWLEEHLKFPLADHDDTVDTTSLALQYLRSVPQTIHAPIQLRIVS